MVDGVETAELSVQSVRDQLEVTSNIEMHYKLVSPFSSTQNYSLIVLVEGGSFQLVLDPQDNLNGSKIGIFAKSILLNATVLAQRGCP